MKHCAECKFSWTSQTLDKLQCLKLNVFINPSDYNEDDHCWLEGSLPEDLPELWKEAVDACPSFAVDIRNPSWSGDSELFTELYWYEIGDPPLSEDALKWMNEHELHAEEIRKWRRENLYIRYGSL